MAKPTSTGSRRSRLRLAAVLAAVAVGIVAALAGGAFADNVTPDGDTALAGNNITYQDPASAGQLACASRGTAATGQIAVTYNGSSHFTAGEAVDVTLTSPDSGITVGYTPTNVPSTWNANGQTFNIPVSTTTSTSVAQGTYTVLVDLAGHTSAYTPNEKSYTVTVGTTCSVTSSAPADPGAPYLDGASTTPNNTGNFTIDWAASSTSGVTYTLEKHNASTTSWTSVASGISTNSYTFTNESEGSWTYRVEAVKNSVASNWATDLAPIVKVDKSNPNAPTAAATTSPDYTDGSGNNWWADTVTVGFTANGDPDLSDGSAGSGVNASTLSANQTFTTLGLHTASGTVQDNAGNTSSAGTLDVYVDNSKPVVTLTCPSSTLTLGSSVTANWSATDTGSGVASGYDSGSINIDTSTVGPHTAQVAAGASQDNVGHSSDASNTCNYSVVYDWTGFFQPVDNLPNWNSAKAGSAIPVKFNLGGNQGTSIFNSGYPKVTQIACPSGGTVTDPIETYTSTAGGSTLTYDTTAMQYIYVWKTDKAWAGKCFTFQLGLNDGTTHNFNVQFTK